MAFAWGILKFDSEIFLLCVGDYQKKYLIGFFKKNVQMLQGNSLFDEKSITSLNRAFY